MFLGQTHSSSPKRENPINERTVGMRLYSVPHAKNQVEPTETRTHVWFACPSEDGLSKPGGAWWLH